MKKINYNTKEEKEKIIASQKGLYLIADVIHFDEKYLVFDDKPQEEKTESEDEKAERLIQAEIRRLAIQNLKQKGLLPQDYAEETDVKEKKEENDENHEQETK